ncbi:MULTISPECIES: hypothetical protein [unclassified Streptomyces]|uniref:hypothetical protein n=1 Tax=unclassified Streptomyces TaxID=2593676 RepID=UPI002E2F9124|nr:hypothetical protein [Streptomyces sp. NBC_01724]WTE64736.1 hypothetical protein OG784_41830 [Streptomyces sp. NBC_01617]
MRGSTPRPGEMGTVLDVLQLVTGNGCPDSGPYVGPRVDVLGDALLSYFAHEGA